MKQAIVTAVLPGTRGAAGADAAATPRVNGKHEPFVRHLSHMSEKPSPFPNKDRGREKNDHPNPEEVSLSDVEVCENATI